MKVSRVEKQSQWNLKGCLCWRSNIWCHATLGKNIGTAGTSPSVKLIYIYIYILIWYGTHHTFPMSCHVMHATKSKWGEVKNKEYVIYQTQPASRHRYKKSTSNLNSESKWNLEIEVALFDIAGRRRRNLPANH